MNEEELFRARIVQLIISGKPEAALESLSHHYRTTKPKLMVGTSKGHRKAAGCYVASQQTIYVSDNDNLSNPYLILHEFYHHLRTTDNKHKGTEKYANRFAQEYIETYRKVP